MENLKTAEVMTDAAVVSCPHCHADTKVFAPSSLHDCESCGAKFSYHFPARKSVTNSTFEKMAMNMTLAQMEAFKAKAMEATKALRELEEMAGSPEPLSDYIGMSYSVLHDEYLENLGCALDSRIEDMKEGIKLMTFFDVCQILDNHGI